MAVAFNNHNAAVRITGGPTSPRTHTTFSVTAGTSLALVVRLSFLYTDSGTPPSATGATWNGVAMTSVGSFTRTPSGHYSELFILANPATGTNDLVISWTVGSAISDMWYDATAYTGVHQSTPARAGTFNSDGSNIGNPATIAFPVTTVSGDMTTTLTNPRSNSVVSTDKTSRSTLVDGLYFYSDDAVSASSSTTHTWTYGSVSAGVCQITGFSIQQTGAEITGLGRRHLGFIYGRPYL
jgi:hypothetical protein